MSDKYEDAMNLKEDGLGKIETPIAKAKRETIERGDELIKQSGFTPSKTVSLNTPLGYINIDVNHLPSKGKFYPTDISIQVRPAELKEIEHWSIMNDNDPLDVDTHLNDILTSCIKVTSNLDKEFTAIDLIEGDRLYLILEIKDKTFIESENAITNEVKCSNCGTKNKRVLTANILETNSTSEEVLEKYYDEELRLYNIKTKSFGEIKMRPPRLGLVKYIFERGRNASVNNEHWDKAFFTLLPFIFEKTSGKVTDLDIDNAYIDFSRMDKKKYAIIYRMAEKIKIGINPDMKIICSSCSEETTYPFRIPGGTKSLFLIQDISDELI